MQMQRCPVRAQPKGLGSAPLISAPGETINVRSVEPSPAIYISSAHPTPFCRHDSSEPQACTHRHPRPGGEDRSILYASFGSIHLLPRILSGPFVVLCVVTGTPVPGEADQGQERLPANVSVPFIFSGRSK